MTSTGLRTLVRCPLRQGNKMNKRLIIKKIEEVLKDKELDEDGKLMFISTYIKLSRKAAKESEVK